ncbi:MAG: hypothetical protein RLZZ324_1010 [Candidatus Parcubacteria bacterium]|jgi:FAD/FMN-containing dehydrogenase
MGSALKNLLASTFRGELHDDPAALKTASQDASLFEITPALVAAPLDAADIGAVVRAANDHPELKISITPRSAGTDMSGGALTESVVLDMVPHFNRIVSVEASADGGVAVTQPGVFYRDFEKATLAKDLLLPPYPASRELCTVGGMAANNSGGEKSLKFGKTEDFVRGLKVVLRDGEEHVLGPLDAAQLAEKMARTDLEGDLYRRTHRLLEAHYDIAHAARPDVSKNSAGYDIWNVWDRKTFDLTKLFVGSQGTLGVITEITFGLVKPARHAKLLVIFLKDLAPLPGIVNAVLAHAPESFESYDDRTLTFAARYSGDIMARLGTSNVFSLAWQFLPELGLLLRNGLPRLVLLAEFTGETAEEVDAKVNAAHADLAAFKLPMRVTRTEEEARKYWVIRRESFNLLRKHFKKVKAAPFIDDFCVRPAHLPEFFPKLYAMLEEYKLTLTVVGHVGDGNFHIIPLMDLSDPDTARVIQELSTRVYALVMSYGGSITGEHNDGLVRSPYLKEMFGAETYALFEEIKRIFDPQGIFNPGKKVGASMAYAMGHLKKE